MARFILSTLLGNREIWAALGDANDVAVQSLSNIRTVRAFSMEWRELKKYMNFTGEALRKRIKVLNFIVFLPQATQDSWVSAGTVAVTNCVDLAIGILLLWYGGLVAMRSPNR